MADLEALSPAQRIWTIGDYPAVARHLIPIATEAVRAVDAGPGRRVLDVGTGDGNATVLLARQGAETFGVDPTPQQLRLTAARLAAAGVQATLELAGAEKLPYPDDHFDAVVSVLGAMFSPHPGQAAGELVRVCRPGGTVVVAAWATIVPSWWDRLDEAVGLAPDAEPVTGPDAWGDPAYCERLFANAGLEVRCEVRPFRWAFATVDEAVELFTTASGPMMAMATSAQGGPERFRSTLRAAIVEANAAEAPRPDPTEGQPGCVLEHPFLLVTGTLDS